METKIANLNHEIGEIDMEICALIRKRKQLEDEKSNLLALPSAYSTYIPSISASPPHTASPHQSTDLRIPNIQKVVKALETTRNTEITVNPPSFDTEFDYEILETAERIWKIKDFRPFQLEIIRSTLLRQDVIGILATGAGKSLCFQLPALLTPGITVVISPLLSLIYDQVEDLRDLNIQAACLTGSTSKEDTREIMRQLNDPLACTIKLIYVTPEKMVKSKRFMSVLEKFHKHDRLARLVVDEAHCCSEYGHDFRPDYKHLGVLKLSFPNVPLIALTATCPSSLLESLCKILSLNRLKTLVYRGPLNRPNLFYSVVSKPTNAEDVVNYMAEWILEHHRNESGIIYCLSKKETEAVSSALNQWKNKAIPSAVYHADISAASKENVHRKWRKGEVKVVVATIAFGMGINNPNVRFVIHHSPSKSLEGYYQESGRAGRDGLRSDCMLLYRGADASRLSTVVFGEQESMDKVAGMIRYCNTSNECRRKLLVRYFNDGGDSTATEWADVTCKKSCDVCCLTSLPHFQDISSIVYAIGKVLSALSETTKMTVNKLVSAYRGRVTGLDDQARTVITELKNMADSSEESKIGNKCVFIYPAPKIVSDEDIERIIIHMIIENYLKQDFHHTSYARLEYLKTQRKLTNWINKCETSSMFIPADDLKLAFIPKDVKAPKKRKSVSNPKTTPSVKVKIDDSEVEEQDENYDSKFVNNEDEDEYEDVVVVGVRKPKVNKVIANIDDDDNDDFEPFPFTNHETCNFKPRQTNDDCDWEYSI